MKGKVNNLRQRGPYRFHGCALGTRCGIHFQVVLSLSAYIGRANKAPWYLQFIPFPSFDIKSSTLVAVAAILQLVMSGALEVAAGAFAAVGVADVAVRTGREVYGFLRGVLDAPDDIKRICDLVEDTTSLAKTSQQCLENLTKLDSAVNTLGVVTSFELSLKSLNRELKSLQVMCSRFRGTTKTWSRIRYVLDERKVGKALENLERSKNLLGNTLILACR